MSRPDQHADTRQRADTRAELHDIVDKLIDAWPTIDSQARDMGRGFGTGGAGAGGSGHGDPTMLLATGRRHLDPGQAANEWLGLLTEFRSQARVLEKRAMMLLPLTAKQVKQLQQRQNTVESCGWCGDPVITGKRFDGALMHNEIGKWCHAEAHRHRRGA